MAAVGSFPVQRAKEPDPQSMPAHISGKSERSPGNLSGASDKADSKPSLQDILSTPEPAQSKRPRSQSQASTTESPNPKAKNQNIIWIDGQTTSAEDQSIQADSYTRAAEFNPSHTMTVTHTRRNANGTVGSVYSGNKIRHLKKEDGIPLYRKDIQLEFLLCIFEDTTPCFTRAFDQSKGHTFADIYIDAMARSSKTSKVLKEKLLADRAGAMSMAMICLLVNVGRMNTTLNYLLILTTVFPEMRAQLRTFHAIPALQANQDPNAYKQLQDAPRLKSILKGASEDLNQPGTIDKIKATPVPRTNPVHLIFVLSQYAPKISEAHFLPPHDFFDLVMRSTLSSKSRARAFLWLIWWYLESDFTAEAALTNPFGPGQPGDGTDGLPIKVPPFEHLTEAQADAENVDTESEIQYGEIKRLERRRILDEDDTVGPPVKKQRKGNDDTNIAISDTDPTRSPSPTSAIQRKASIDFGGTSLAAPSPMNENGFSQIRYPTIASKSDPSNPQRAVLKTRMDNTLSSSPPPPPGSSHLILSAASNGNRRPRPETSHQKAVNMNRKMRIDHILHSQMVAHQSEVRRQRRRNSSSFGMTVMNRVKDLPDMYNTDDENSWGPGGLITNRTEMDDYGEEAVRHKKVIDRAMRRLYREENGGRLGGLVAGYNRRKRKSRGYAEDEYEQEETSRKKRKEGSHMGDQETHSRGVGAYEEGLDDLDLDLLGENRDEDQEEDSGSDDSDGEDADMTEDDMGQA
ncbi:MAG: hypothetical protein Q9217_006583 [Psora testacea]